MKALIRLLLFGAACFAMPHITAQAQYTGSFNDPGQAGGFGIPGGAVAGPVNSGPVVSEWTAPTWPGITWFSINGAKHGLGFEDSYVTGGVKTRLGEDAFRGRWMFEGRAHLDLDDGAAFANIGFERGFTIEPAKSDVYIGFWYDYDGDEARNFGHTFHQVGLSAKVKNRAFEFRTNGYIPVATTSYELGTVGQQFFGNNLLLQPGLDVALRGFDMELGIPLPNLAMFGASLDLGGYYYNSSSDFVDPTGGFRARLNLKSLNGVGLQTELNHDDVFKTTWVARVVYQFGGAAAYDRNGRDLERTVRNDHIVRVHQDPIFLINAANGDPFRFIFVDNTLGNGGNGTFEDPFNELVDAENASRDFDVIFVRNNNPIIGDTTGQDIGIDLRFGQQLLAGGVNHPLISANAGVFDLLIDDGGEIPTIDNVNGGPAVGLAGANTVRGFNFELTNATSAFFADGAGGLTLIDQNMVTGTDGGIRNNGIIFNNAPVGSEQIVTNTDLLNLDGRGIDIFGGTPDFLFDGGDIDQTGLAQDPLNPIRIRNTTGGEVTVQGGLVMADNSSGILIANSTSDINLFSSITLGTPLRGLDIQSSSGTLNVTELTIDDSVAQSIRAQNNSVGVLDANFLLTNITRGAGTALADAVLLEDNAGSIFTFDTLNIDNGNGGGLIASNSGTININDGVIIAMNGPAIDINPTTVDITLSTVMSTNSTTTGVRLDQVDGSFNADTITVSGVDVVTGIDITNSGLLNLDVTNATVQNTNGGTPGAAAVNLVDNDVAGSTFNFDSITIDSVDSDGLVVENTVGFSVGDLTVTNVNGAGNNGLVLTNIDDDITFSGVTEIDGVNGAGGRGVAISGMATDNAIITFNDLRIDNTTGTAFDVNGGANTVNVTLGGAGLVNDTGRAVAIQNTATGSNVTFDGADITDTGLGILINDNVGVGSQFAFNNTVNVDVNTVGNLGAVEITDNIAAGSATTFADLNIVTNATGMAGLFADNNTSLTVTQGTITAVLGPAIDVQDTTVNLELTNVSSANSTTQGIDFDSVTGVANFNGTTNINGVNIVTGVDITNSTGFAVDFDNLNVLNTNGGLTGTAAVNLADNDGASTFNFDNLIINNVDGDGLVVNNTTGVTVDGGAIAVTNGAAAEVQNSTVDVTLTTTSSTNSGDNGLLLTNLGVGSSFDAGAINIVNPGTTGINVQSLANGVTFTVNGGTMNLNTGGSTGVLFRHNGNVGATHSVSNVAVTFGADNVVGYDVRDVTAGGNPNYALNNFNVNMADRDNSIGIVYGAGGVEGLGTVLFSQGNIVNNVDVGNGSFGFLDNVDNMAGLTVGVVVDGVAAQVNP